MRCFILASLTCVLFLSTLTTATAEPDAASEPKQTTTESLEEAIAKALKEAEGTIDDVLEEALEGVDVDEDEDDIEELPAPWNRKQDPKHLKKLDEIVLPKNPSREQCQDYIKELQTLVQNKRMFSDDDPEVDKLKAIPAKHFDLVFALLGSHFGLDFYAEQAIEDIDPKTIRKAMVEHLEENPSNITIIVMYGWVNDAKPVIMKKFKTADNDLSVAWFQAFVELAEAEHHPRLHELAVGSANAAQCIDLLKTLPGYDVSATIDACWANRSNTRNRRGFSPFYTREDPMEALAVHAAQNGEIEALDYLIRRLQGTSPDRFGGDREGINTTRLNVTRFLPYRGSNDEIIAWFRRYKDQLVFDRFKNRFVVEE